MLDCWEEQPSSRPSFQNLVVQFETLHKKDDPQNVSIVTFIPKLNVQFTLENFGAFFDRLR